MQLLLEGLPYCDEDDRLNSKFTPSTVKDDVWSCESMKTNNARNCSSRSLPRGFGAIGSATITEAQHGKSGFAHLVQFHCFVSNTLPSAVA